MLCSYVVVSCVVVDVVDVLLNSIFGFRPITSSFSAFGGTSHGAATCV